MVKQSITPQPAVSTFWSDRLPAQLSLELQACHAAGINIPLSHPLASVDTDPLLLATIRLAVGAGLPVTMVDTLLSRVVSSPLDVFQLLYRFYRANGSSQLSRLDGFFDDIPLLSSDLVVTALELVVEARVSFDDIAEVSRDLWPAILELSKQGFDPMPIVKALPSVGTSELALLVIRQQADGIDVEPFLSHPWSYDQLSLLLYLEPEQCQFLLSLGVSPVFSVAHLSELVSLMDCPSSVVQLASSLHEDGAPLFDAYQIRVLGYASRAGIDPRLIADADLSDLEMMSKVHALMEG